MPPVNICYYSCSSPTGSGNEIKNNLFVNTGTGDASQYGASLYIGTAGFTRSSFAVGNNVFARATGTNVVCLVGSCSVGNGAIAAGVDANAAFAMPAFVRYAPVGGARLPPRVRRHRRPRHGRGAQLIERARIVPTPLPSVGCRKPPPER